MPLLKPLLLALFLPLAAHAAGPKGSMSDDLSAPIVRHEASCPPPGEALCMMRAPTAASFQVLSQGVSVERQGDWWLVAFPGVKPGSRKGSFHVAAADGVVHEVAVAFAFSQKAADKAREKAEEEALLKQKAKEDADKARKDEEAKKKP